MSELDLLHNNRRQISTVLERCEFVFKDEPNWTSPDDTSYLNARDRADPNIMANVEAMAATNQMIDWFGNDNSGHAGVWRATGHVVHLDTEGQYAIVARDVGDYLARAAHSDDFEAARAALIAAGFKVSNDLEAIYTSISGAPDVNAVRNELFKDGRVRRGLPRDY
jgi:hypothetical protein